MSERTSALFGLVGGAVASAGLIFGGIKMFPGFIADELGTRLSSDSEFVQTLAKDPSLASNLAPLISSTAVTVDYFNNGDLKPVQNPMDLVLSVPEGNLVDACVLDTTRTLPTRSVLYLQGTDKMKGTKRIIEVHFNDVSHIDFTGFVVCFSRPAVS